MATYYKILSEDGKSIHKGNLKWSLPTQLPDGSWQPGDWHTVTGKVVVCSNGLHLTTAPYEWYAIGCTCYVAEGRGVNQSNENKTAFAEARLLYPVAHPQWWLDALSFIGSIKTVPFLKPDGKPLKEWKLFAAPTLDAAAQAAAQAAGAANREWAKSDAADAAWANAREARTAKVAGQAAWANAWNLAAVRDAREARTAKVAGQAAWVRVAAAWANAASLYVQVVCICADLKIKTQHTELAKKHWQVWEKGYCLHSEVNRILYVYAKE